MALRDQQCYPLGYSLLDTSSVPFTALGCFLLGPRSSGWLSPASPFTGRPHFSDLPGRGRHHGVQEEDGLWPQMSWVGNLVLSSRATYRPSLGLRVLR